MLNTVMKLQACCHVGMRFAFAGISTFAFCLLYYFSLANADVTNGEGDLFEQSGLRWEWKTFPLRQVKSTKFRHENLLNRDRLNETDGLAANDVQAIAVSHDDVFAFGTNHGLSILRKGILQMFTGPEHVVLTGASEPTTFVVPGNSPLVGNDVRAVLFTRDGTLWVATSRGLCRFRTDLLEVLRIKSLSPDILPWNDFVMTRFYDTTALFASSSGKIFAGGHHSRVTTVDPNTDTVETIYEAGDENQCVMGFAEDNEKNLWVGVMGLGVLRRDPEGTWKLHTKKTDPWIPSNNVTCLCIDSTQALWVGTEKGIGVRLPDGTSRIYTTGSILPNVNVRGIQVRRSGDVWVATEKGFAVFSDEGWRYPVPDKPFFLASGGWNPMVETDKGVVWLGTSDGVLINPRFRIVKENPVQTSRANIKKMIEERFPIVSVEHNVVGDGSRSVWWYDGNRLLSYDGKTWTDHTYLLVNDSWAVLKCDSQHRIWILTGHGLIQVDPGGEPTPVKLPGERHTWAFNLAEGGSGTIYYADGTYRVYALKGKQWNVLGDGTFPDGCLQPVQMLEDKKGRLWVVDMNFGLVRFDGRKVTHVSRLGVLAGWQVKSVSLLPDDVIRVSALRRTSQGVERKVFLCRDDHVVQAQNK